MPTYRGSVEDFDEVRGALGVPLHEERLELEGNLLAFLDADDGVAVRVGGVRVREVGALHHALPVAALLARARSHYVRSSSCANRQTRKANEQVETNTDSFTQ